MKQQVVSFSSREDRVVQKDLQAALDAGRVGLHYQPVYQASCNTMVGAEALVRWKHEYGLRTADAFIAAVEHSDAIHRLGLHVLQVAIHQAASWYHAGRPLRIAVNVAPQQLAWRGFAESALAILSIAGLPNHLLDIEVTERISGVSVSEIARELAVLRSAGVQVSLDDFGTGQNGLALLRHLQVDALKIDQSFVADLPSNPRAAAVVQALIAAGNVLGVRIVAEGVETPAQQDILVRLGCHELQGYGLARPQSAAVITRLLTPEQPASFNHNLEPWRSED